MEIYDKIFVCYWVSACSTVVCVDVEYVVRDDSWENRLRILGIIFGLDRY